MEVISSKRTIDQILKEGRKTTATDLLVIFDDLPEVSIEEMIGTWKGEEFITGHFMEGALASSGWYGKEFKSREQVHPLLYYRDAQRTRIFQLNPSLASFHPFILGIMKTGIAHLIIRLLRPIIQTQRYTARLRMLTFRGKTSATMIYDRQPICDVFRKVDENTLLGLMDKRDMDTYCFFILSKCIDN